MSSNEKSKKLSKVIRLGKKKQIKLNFIPKTKKTRPAITGIFPPSQFGKDAILKDENVFSPKNTHLFQRSKPFDFLPNKPLNKGGKNIFKKYYLMTLILQQTDYL